MSTQHNQSPGPSGHPVEPEPLITLRPKYGLKVTLQAIEEN